MDEARAAHQRLLDELRNSEEDKKSISGNAAAGVVKTLNWDEQVGEWAATVRSVPVSSSPSLSSMSVSSVRSPQKYDKIHPTPSYSNKQVLTTSSPSETESRYLSALRVLETLSRSTPGAVISPEFDPPPRDVSSHQTIDSDALPLINPVGRITLTSPSSRPADPSTKEPIQVIRKYDYVSLMQREISSQFGDRSEQVIKNNIKEARPIAAGSLHNNIITDKDQLSDSSRKKKIKSKCRYVEGSPQYSSASDQALSSVSSRGTVVGDELTCDLTRRHGYHNSGCSPSSKGEISTSFSFKNVLKKNSSKTFTSSIIPTTNKQTSNNHVNKISREKINNENDLDDWVGRINNEIVIRDHHEMNIQSKQITNRSDTDYCDTLLQETPHTLESGQQQNDDTAFSNVSHYNEIEMHDNRIRNTSQESTSSDERETVRQKHSNRIPDYQDLLNREIASQNEHRRMLHGNTIKTEVAQLHGSTSSEMKLFGEPDKQLLDLRNTVMRCQEAQRVATPLVSKLASKQQVSSRPVSSDSLSVGSSRPTTSVSVVEKLKNAVITSNKLIPQLSSQSDCNQNNHEPDILIISESPTIKSETVLWEERDDQYRQRKVLREERAQKRLERKQALEKKMNICRSEAKHVEVLVPEVALINSPLRPEYIIQSPTDVGRDECHSRALIVSSELLEMEKLSNESPLALQLLAKQQAQNESIWIHELNSSQQRDEIVHQQRLTKQSIWLSVRESVWEEHGIREFNETDEISAREDLLSHHNNWITNKNGLTVVEENHRQHATVISREWLKDSSYLQLSNIHNLADVNCKSLTQQEDIDRELLINKLTNGKHLVVVLEQFISDFHNIEKDQLVNFAIVLSVEVQDRMKLIDRLSWTANCDEVNTRLDIENDEQQSFLESTFNHPHSFSVVRWTLQQLTQMHIKETKIFLQASDTSHLAIATEENTERELLYELCSHHKCVILREAAKKKAKAVQDAINKASSIEQEEPQQQQEQQQQSNSKIMNKSKLRKKISIKKRK